MRCAIYARVSTELDTQRTSIDNQIDIFKNYVAQKGWKITKIYTDKKSGTKSNRSELKSLIEGAKKGEFDVILAKELSRLARNGKLSYELRDICQNNNIEIVCLDNSINTVEGNIQNFGLFAWLYETESTNSSRRNKQAKLARARRGLFIGSIPPFGYYSKNGLLKVRNDETPSVVRRIFNEYLEGKGMDSIAKGLTA
ncbi:recombinase family protein [Gottfriedia sp. NPDC057948]|uniref:recombinase family protein n=1 Tax=Gottfriedia sp. NPDC057948 TaxID=3346287 RepID=UPI0036DAF217